MSIRHSLAVLGLSLIAAPAFGATIAPTIEMTLGGLSVGSVQWEADPNDPDVWHASGYYSGAEGQISLYATLDADPQIVYAIAVIDFGGPSGFGFSFSQPIVPTAAPGVATHSQSSSTTDADGGGTPVTALPPPGGIPVDGDLVTEQFVYTLSQDGGTTFLNVGLDIRPSFVGASPSDTQAAINLGPVAGPAGAGSYNFMRVDVNFSMAGGSDAYTWNGIATIEVPEPSTAALLALGLGGLVAFGSRRRS